MIGVFAMNSHKKKIAHELLHIRLSAWNNYKTDEEILKKYDTGINFNFSQWWLWSVLSSWMSSRVLQQKSIDPTEE